MKKVVYYPSIDVTHTYISTTAEGVESIEMETEDDIERSYGIGWNDGRKVLYDDTIIL